MAAGMERERPKPERRGIESWRTCAEADLEECMAGSESRGSKVGDMAVRSCVVKATAILSTGWPVGILGNLRGKWPAPNQKHCTKYEILEVRK